MLEWTVYKPFRVFLKLLTIQRTFHQWLNVKTKPRGLTSLTFLQSTSSCELWYALGDVVCRTSDVVVAVFLVLKFKPFTFFVSDKKFNSKIEETKNNVDVSNSWFLSTMKIQVTILVFLRSLIHSKNEYTEQYTVYEFIVYKSHFNARLHACD